MSASEIPSLTLPTSDYEEMLTMSNRRLVCVFRSVLLSPENRRRFSPRPPEEHDAYLVRHEPGHIEINLCVAGEVVFRCRFIPAAGFS